MINEVKINENTLINFKGLKITGTELEQYLKERILYKQELDSIRKQLPELEVADGSEKSITVNSCQEAPAGGVIYE